jgi:hypothetical protein
LESGFAKSAAMTGHIYTAMPANNDNPVSIRLRFICSILLRVQRGSSISDDECRRDGFRRERMIRGAQPPRFLAIL